MQPTKLTKTAIDRMDFEGATPKSHDVRWDTEISGFGVRVHPSGKKVFILRYRCAGVRRLLTLGVYGAITLDQARMLARKELGKLADQQDPLTLRKQAKVKAQQDELTKTTLRQAFETYKASRQLRPKTLKDYDRAMGVNLKDWLALPLTRITREMIAARHKALKPADANLTMRVLRAVFNHAMETYILDDGSYLIPRNPVAVLSKAKAWAKVSARNGHVNGSQLPAWFVALDEEENPILRDYLLFVLLTGLRREDASSLRWEHVDFGNRSITIIEPKAHDILTLPMTNRIHDLLRARRETSTSPFVFPGDGKLGYVREPRKALERIFERSGIKTTVHDLRRSYAKFGADVGLEEGVIKQLLGHSLAGNVTRLHYTQTSLERLRGPAQRIEDYILARASQSDNVVPFPLAQTA